MSYRKFDTLTWVDPWFEKLSKDAKLAFIYFWTNDACNISGIYEISRGRIQFELGFDVSPVLNDLSKKVVLIDKKNIVWVKNFFRRQCQNSKGAISALGYVENDLESLATFVNYNRKKLEALSVPIDQYKINPTVIPYSIPHTIPEKPKSIPENQVSTRQSFEEIKENIKENIVGQKPDPIPYKEIIDHLNKKTASNYKPTSKATIRLIRARWNDGFQIDDFKRVVDNKVEAWSSDPKMSQYLRPETLFGTKFESYLNEKKVVPINTSGGLHVLTDEEIYGTPQ